VHQGHAVGVVSWKAVAHLSSGDLTTSV